MKDVKVYTDGACSGNPGPGGWCAVLVYRGREKTVSGAEKLTTNNRMELSAVIAALSLLKEPCRVHLVSDSRYVVDAVEKGWLEGWKKKNWKRADGKDVQNPELWQALEPLLCRHEVTFEWIKGHAGHPYNERCDAVAVECARRIAEEETT